MYWLLSSFFKYLTERKESKSLSWEMSSRETHDFNLKFCLVYFMLTAVIFEIVIIRGVSLLASIRTRFASFTHSGLSTQYTCLRSVSYI